MERFRDSGYAMWVEKGINEKEEVKKIIDRVGENGLYLIGGAVRDPVVKFLYGKDIEVFDYDFFSSDKTSDDLRQIFGNYDNVVFSRFGNPKFIFDDFEVDLVAADNTIAEKRYGRSADIEGVLYSADINTSSIGYGLFDSYFYSEEAMQGILNSRVDIMNSTSLDADLTRLVLHSEKLGFDLGEKSLDFICKNYNDNMDSDILNYLSYKNKSDKKDLVLTRLKEIKSKKK